MEIGALADWAEAGAELLAVCVALFMPYYTAYKAKKHRQRNLQVVLQRLVQAVLEGQPDSLKTLDIFLKISFLSNEDANNDELLLTGNQVVALYADQTLSAAARQARVIQLMAQVQLPVTVKAPTKN